MKMLKMIAEISIAKLEDRKTVTAILHENGYTVGPGKRKKTETGKTIRSFHRILLISCCASLEMPGSA